jgi:hypothetical protein
MSVIVIGGNGTKRSQSGAAKPQLTFQLPTVGRSDLYVSQFFVNNESEPFKGFYIGCNPPSNGTTFYPFNSITIPQKTMVLTHAQANSNYGGEKTEGALKKLYQLEFGGSPKYVDRETFEKQTGEDYSEVLRTNRDRLQMPLLTYVNIKDWTPQTERGRTLKQIALDDNKIMESCKGPKDLKKFERAHPPTLPPGSLLSGLTETEAAVDSAITTGWTPGWSRVARALCSDGFDETLQMFLKHKQRYLKAFRVYESSGFKSRSMPITTFLNTL